MKLRVVRHEVVQPLDQSYRLIPLTQGQNAIVDAEDFERLNQWNWCAMWSRHGKCFYAQRHLPENQGRRIIRMHEVLVGAGADHISHSTLDNRKSNLRAATKSQNTAHRRKQSNNRSGFIGVSFHKQNRKWQANVRDGGKWKYLGTFATAEEAARARDKAAKELYGEFAVLNFYAVPRVSAAPNSSSAGGAISRST